MLRIGIVGFGFMGRMHYANWRRCENAKVVAICDTNPNIIEKSKKAYGNIEGAGQAIDFDEVKVFTDYEKMLAESAVDAVSITVPTYLHCSFSVKALESGVHVLCEKPMALDTEECRRMIDTAKESGKILQVGHCIRFWPEYARTKEIVDSGEYGKVIAASFRRLGSAPSWGAEDWFAKDDLSGGVGLDLHIHDSDFVQYLFGMPKSVHSYGNTSSGKGLKHIFSRYLFDDEKVVTAEGSWAMAPSFGFEMSFNVVMEKATIVFDCTRKPSFKICPVNGDVLRPEVPKGDGYSLEIEHFAGLINGLKLPEVTSPEESLNSIRLVKAEIESIQNKTEIKI